MHNWSGWLTPTSTVIGPSWPLLRLDQWEQNPSKVTHAQGQRISSPDGNLTPEQVRNLMAFDGAESEWGTEHTEETIEGAVQKYIGTAHKIRFGATYGGQ